MTDKNVTAPTDAECRAAIAAMVPDRIQGFSYGLNYGPPHLVRDVTKPYGEQVLWRGDSAEEMQERCKIERMRLALAAAAEVREAAEPEHCDCLNDDYCNFEAGCRAKSGKWHASSAERLTKT